MSSLALALAATLVVSPAAAQPAPPNVDLPIRFARGTHQRTVSNAVYPGRRHVYTLRARAGQTIAVRIASRQDDAVFVINGTTAEFRNIGGGADAIILVPLTGRDNSGVRAWRGRLPAAGQYAILVMATGEALSTYRLTVRLR